jgi:exopolysaccharide biosynthesis polyprenyl glycosylphosphotransferase
MLRQFSFKRVLGFFLLDWLGSLALLYWASSLRTTLGVLPLAWITRLESLNILVGLHGAFNPQDPIFKLSLLIIVAILWPFFFTTFSVYDGRRNPTLLAELRNVAVATCVSAVALAGILFLTYRDTSRVFFLLFVLLDLLLLLGSRIIFHLYRLLVKKKNYDRQRKVLIVGFGEVGRNVVEQIRKFSLDDLQLIGYLDDDPDKQGQEIDNLPILGTLEQVSEVVAKFHVRDAVIALPLRAHERLISICSELQKLSVRVHVIPDIFALAFPSTTLDGFGGIPVIDLGVPGIQGKKRTIKRVFDLLVGGISLILISPLLLVVAILIKLDSSGPVIYRQKRVGENGRIFTMFKFRSMKNNADNTIHQKHVARLIQQNLSPEQVNGNKEGTLKMDNDPRITRIGRFIRKTSLDELPQLFNVFRGEMSLVGPRPDVPYAVELYQEWHKRRFEALPGMTGWWQVKGHNRVSYDEMMRMDIYYIDHMSLWLDIKILFLTPWEVLFGKGMG